MVKYYITVVILSVFVIAGCGKDDNPASPSTKGTITGKVIDQSTGNGIGGASIHTQPSTSAVNTDNNGNYTIPEVEAGDYTITVETDGFFPGTVNVSVDAGQTSTKNISLSAIPADPVASYNYGGTTVTPASITFQNASENATNYLWDFGDGTTSTAANPSKSYNQMGHYTVTLTASNNVTGKSNVMTKNITITPGKVYLQKVIVDAIPFSDANGAGWDFGSGPDLYFTLSDSVIHYVSILPLTYVADLRSFRITRSMEPYYRIPITKLVKNVLYRFMGL